MSSTAGSKEVVLRKIIVKLFMILRQRGRRGLREMRWNVLSLNLSFVG